MSFPEQEARDRAVHETPIAVQALDTVSNGTRSEDIEHPKYDSLEQTPRSADESVIEHHQPPKTNATDGVTRGLPKCHMHVFRHISKAAGTTMRFIFDKQVRLG